MKLVCHLLNRVADEGLLKDKGVFMDVTMLMDATSGSNLLKTKNGKRYTNSVKEFYEVLMYWGGPRVAAFVAQNMDGPEIHSMYCWRKQKCLV